MTSSQAAQRFLTATGSGPKLGDFPVGSLESRAAARAALRRAAEVASERWRVVVTVLGESLDLELSTCHRYWAGECLVELVSLHGSADGLTAQQLDEFVKGFPISPN